ncbi:MAG: XRE family transcriptional regulator [Tannerella sp.]|jgi:HTH-type transcriptional regulator/antitoxin HigA|nr:XRE family transcriptional regulator [Tannerella sp.]
MIKNERQYDAVCARIEELLKVVGNDTPVDDRNFIELDILSDLVADYEEAKYPVKNPELPEPVKFRV